MEENWLVISQDESKGGQPLAQESQQGSEGRQDGSSRLCTHQASPIAGPEVNTCPNPSPASAPVGRRGRKLSPHLPYASPTQTLRVDSLLLLPLT